MYKVHQLSECLFGEWGELVFDLRSVFNDSKLRKLTILLTIAHDDEDVYSSTG